MELVSCAGALTSLLDNAPLIRSAEWDRRCRCFHPNSRSTVAVGVENGSKIESDRGLRATQLVLFVPILKRWLRFNIEPFVWSFNRKLDRNLTFEYWGLA